MGRYFWGDFYPSTLTKSNFIFSGLILITDTSNEDLKKFIRVHCLIFVGLEWASKNIVEKKILNIL